MNTKEVVIVDYGIGNIFSVKKAFESIEARTAVTSDPKIIQNSKYLVLPGVGAYGKAMRALEELNLIEPIKHAAAKGVPLLGICLGMQLLLDESDELGLNNGLGLIPGRVEDYPKLTNLDHLIKVPQINWHELVKNHNANDWSGSILSNYKYNDGVYFVHSFVARPVNNEHIIACYESGSEKIPAVIMKGNIIGCQFHPEKSGQVGLKMLKNFINL